MRLSTRNFGSLPEMSGRKRMGMPWTAVTRRASRSRWTGGWGLLRPWREEVDKSALQDSNSKSYRLQCNHAFRLLDLVATNPFFQQQQGANRTVLPGNSWWSRYFDCPPSLILPS